MLRVFAVVSYPAEVCTSTSNKMIAYMICDFT
eukprot:SAG31_NODE_27404_length_426_cov_1.266055_1_plen_31_part_10